MAVVGGDDWKCQLSIKFGPMQEAMLNVRADSPHELDQMVEDMDSLIAGNPAGLLSTLRDLNQAFTTPAPAGGQGGGYIPPATAVAPQPQRSCPHGTMEYKEGPDWRGYFCPLPKGSPGKCKAQYVR